MDNQRFILITALLVLGFWIFIEWNAHFDETPDAEEPTEEVVEEEMDPDAPPERVDDQMPDPDEPVDPEDEPEEAPEPVAEPEEGERIGFRTSSMEGELDTLGGELRRLDLRGYRESLDEPDLVRLLDDRPDRLFIVQPGIWADEGAALPPRGEMEFELADKYAVDSDGERVADGRADPEEDEALGQVVELLWTSDAGLELLRRIEFPARGYRVEVEQELRNESGEDWAGRDYLELERNDPGVSRSLFNPATFSHNGPAYHDTERYERLDFDDLREADLEERIPGGWAAMVEHYFVAAAIPGDRPYSEDKSLTYYTRDLDGQRFRIGFVDSRSTEIADGDSRSFHQKLYLGPKIQSELRPSAPDLERVVDYGIMWIIAQPLFTGLDWIENVVGNWGWSIIILTILIKLLFYKLAETSGRSLARMRKLQPRLQTLRERYADDKQKLNQAMMELYRREKVNPAAGCLPILVQIPVFIALYWVLLESAELRHAPWLGWIQDLSSPDPYFILPVIMGASMFIQQKLNPPPPDPTMRKVIMAMPLMLIFIGIFMPAGLVLYWAVNTILSAAQQWKINRVIEQEGHAPGT